MIRNLGGDVVNDGSFDPSATHLMCLRPSRNEKMLGSIASGKWVLHCMYLRDSEANGNFLDVSIGISVLGIRVYTMILLLSILCIKL